MNSEEVREIVKMTIEELISTNTISDTYPRIKATVENELRDYFNNDNLTVAKALNNLSNDPYIEIIYLYYRDNKTLEDIAEILDKDVTTISRNKKRLVIQLFKGLESLQKVK